VAHNPERLPPRPKRAVNDGEGALPRQLSHTTIRWNFAAEGMNLCLPMCIA
jgi:hypothetical protein